MKLGNGTFLKGDCLELMKDIPQGTVDLILCDLPYGTTSCAWDSVIPFEPLWEQYWRVIKANGAIVLTSAQPFTTALISSQIKHFKYTWVWDKISVTGFANASKQPLRHLEDVCVFYKKQPTYNPQGVQMASVVRKNSASQGGATLKGEHISNGKGSLRTAGKEHRQEFTNFPKQRIEISRETGFHPTQKPVALFEYIIKTYTNPGEIVLDNTAGSGTTAIAAENTKRQWICMEQNDEYYEKAVERVKDNNPSIGNDLFSF